MALAFINTATADLADGVTNTLTCSKPASTTDGDIMFAIVIHQTIRANSVPAGWTSLGSNYDALSEYYELFYKVASSEGADYTWGFAETHATKITIVTYRGGFDTTSPIDVTSNTRYVTNNTTLRAASMVVTSAGSALIFIGGVGSTASKTFTKPSVPTTDWVEDVDSGSTTSDFWVTCCSMTWSGSGATGTMDDTISATLAEKHAFAVALKPLSSTYTLRPNLLTLGVG